MSTSAKTQTSPSSTASPSSLFKWPGITPASTAVLRRTLEENDRRFDIWGKRRFEHNHFAHSQLTRYALGATPKLLEETWAHDQRDLTSIDPRERGVGEEKVPPAITRENWSDPRWLGQKEAFLPYLTFFHAEIERLGSLETVKQYLFSVEANSGGKGNKAGPRMMIRLVAGVIHPFIHVGFGLEFGDKIVLAEGLAEAAVHSPDLEAALFPDDWPQATLPNHPNEPSKSLLDIYTEFSTLPSLAPGPYDPDALINTRLKDALKDGKADETRRLVSLWSLEDVDLEGQGLQKKLEEIAILTTLLTGATGRPGKEKRVDFFLMHTLTSSIFLPSYLSPLSLSERRIVLQSYLLVVLHTVLARGRPKLDTALLMSYSENPSAKDYKVSAKGTDTIGAPTYNPWTHIIDTSLHAKDSHVPKAIRSLVHYSSLYGNTQEQDGIDGTIFIRCAGAVMDVTGWVLEGEQAGGWDMSALGWDGAWE
ncbi:hypothetical protein P7C73_g2910, partial [Tremellales sp. Uapishka_1]